MCSYNTRTESNNLGINESIIHISERPEIQSHISSLNHDVSSRDRPESPVFMTACERDEGAAGGLNAQWVRQQDGPFQLSFNASLKVDFRGSRVTSDGGLILVRELDQRLGFGGTLAVLQIGAERNRCGQVAFSLQKTPHCMLQ